MLDTVTKIIFLDIDGCVTSVEDGTYFNPDPAKYHPSTKIINRLVDFCKVNDVKIVISSNWRKFDIDGEWKNNGEVFKNPIVKTEQMLGDTCIGTLPKVRHIKKAQALILWLEETGYEGNFVIFDDDLREEYQMTHDHHIKDKFILIDSEFGITVEDLNNAKKILDKAY